MTDGQKTSFQSSSEGLLSALFALLRGCRFVKKKTTHGKKKPERAKMEQMKHKIILEIPPEPSRHGVFLACPFFLSPWKRFWFTSAQKEKAEKSKLGNKHSVSWTTSSRGLVKPLNFLSCCFEILNNFAF